MVDLYFLPGSASMAPHAVLIETGTPHRLVRVERGGDPDPAFLAVSPAGRVPAVRDGDLTLTESAAICMHYADRAPAAGLAPPAGSDARAQWYRWHCTLTNTVQEAFYRAFAPGRFVDDDGRASVIAHANDTLAWWRERLAGELAGRPYLVGDACTSADLYLCMLIRWTRRMPEPYWDDPVLAAYFRRIADRPSYREVWQTEGLDRDGEPAPR